MSSPLAPSAPRARSNAVAAPGRRRRRLNLTGLQFGLFAGAAVLGLAALSAAGAALALALAGAGVLAALVLGVWVIGANLIGLERRR